MLEPDSKNHGGKTKKVVSMHVCDEYAVQFVAPKTMCIEHFRIAMSHTASVGQLVENAHLSECAYT